jgi:hypothetical protein
VHKLCLPVALHGLDPALGEVGRERVNHGQGASTSPTSTRQVIHQFEIGRTVDEVDGDAVGKLDAGSAWGGDSTKSSSKSKLTNNCGFLLQSAEQKQSSSLARGQLYIAKNMELLGNLRGVQCSDHGFHGLVVVVVDCAIFFQRAVGKAQDFVPLVLGTGLDSPGQVNVRDILKVEPCSGQKPIDGGLLADGNGPPAQESGPLMVADVFPVKCTD